MKGRNHSQLSRILKHKLIPAALYQPGDYDLYRQHAITEGHMQLPPSEVDISPRPGFRRVIRTENGRVAFMRAMANVLCSIEGKPDRHPGALNNFLRLVEQAEESQFLADSHQNLI